jgi:hypothetical protein
MLSALTVSILKIQQPFSLTPIAVEILLRRGSAQKIVTESGIYPYKNAKSDVSNKN